MKAYAKKIISGAVLGMALLAPTAPTWAGLKLSQVSQEVIIAVVGDQTQATGSVRAARYSSDNQQSIGCLISSTPGYSIVYCSAWNKTGTSLTCSTDNPGMMKAVRNMNNDSNITFATRPGSSTCSGITIENYSSLLK